MALSDVEKQASYRRRQKQKLVELVEEIERLRALVMRFSSSA